VSKRILIFTLALGIVMSLVMGGIAFADQATSTQATPVTLTVYFERYDYPSKFPELAQMTENIVKNYEKLHPNVQIKLIPDTFGEETNYETWLTAQFAAGTEPDISWEQYYQRWVEKGWWIPLNKYLEEPDPYAAPGQGREHWKDCVPNFVWDSIIAPDGNSYTVDLDWVETGVFYNKEIFDKLGISPNFTTWDQFMQDLKIIKAHGYIPFDFGMSGTTWTPYQWIDDIFTTSAFADQVPEMYMPKYSELYKQTYDGEEWRVLTPEETAKAIYDGIYSTNNPRFVEFLKLMKQFSEYWPSGFTSLDYDSMLSLFLSGKAAMVWLGSWSMPEIAQSAPFKWGLTYLPPLSTEQIPQLPKIFQDVSFRVGGPNGAAQYGITIGAEKNHVVSWAVDFLKYLSTPNTMGKVAAASEMYIPMIKGTEVNPAIAFFEKIASYPTRAFMDPEGRFPPAIANEYGTIMENYLVGSINMETAQKQIQEVLNEYVKEMASEYHYSWYK